MDIDLVYTWVENSAQHQQKRRTHAPDRKKHASNRFTDSGELRFSLRSVYEHAPWIRRVWIVVDDDQRPGWLSPASDHASIPVTVVRHSDIYPKDAKHLPTFNSQSIESHLHRIPGLSEFFIYANDDMFFGNVCQPDDFFTKSGRPRYVLHGRIHHKINKNMTKHAMAWANNCTLLKAHFPHKKVSNLEYPMHQMVPMLKSSFVKCWADAKIKPTVMATSASKFRKNTNIYFIGFLVYFNIFSSLAARGNLTHQYVNLTDQTNFRVTLNLLKRTKPQLFCLNDNLKNRRTGGGAALTKLLQMHFPTPTIIEHR